MIFGTGTWFYNDIAVAEALKKIKNAGLDAAEVWMEHLLRSDDDTADVKAAAGEMNLTLSLHAASYDLNMTSFNKGIRDESRKQTIDSIITGARIGAKTVVIHPGRISSSKGAKEEYTGELYKFLREIDSIADSEGVVIGLEVMEKRPREILVTPEDVINLMRQSWKNLKLTIDIAHARTVMDPSEFLNSLNHEWITHIHLSDSSASRPHLPLGKGDSEINKALKTLSEFYRGVIIIEGYLPGRGDEVIADNVSYLRENGWI